MFGRSYCASRGVTVSREGLIEAAKLGRVIGHSREARAVQAEKQHQHTAPGSSRTQPRSLWMGVRDLLSLGLKSTKKLLGLKKWPSPRGASTEDCGNALLPPRCHLESSSATPLYRRRSCVAARFAHFLHAVQLVLRASKSRSCGSSRYIGTLRSGDPRGSIHTASTALANPCTAPWRLAGRLKCSRGRSASDSAKCHQRSRLQVFPST